MNSTRTIPTVYQNDTIGQLARLKGLIKMHRKAEKAFARFGVIENAKLARQHRIVRIAQLKALLKAIR